MLIEPVNMIHDIVLISGGFNQFIKVDTQMYMFVTLGAQVCMFLNVVRNCVSERVWFVIS